MSPPYPYGQLPVQHESDLPLNVLSMVYSAAGGCQWLHLLPESELNLLTVSLPLRSTRDCVTSGLVT